MVRSGQPTGVLIPVVYLFGGEIESHECDGYASVAHRNHDETQGQGDFILVRASEE
jgi:hypothetical protein